MVSKQSLEEPKAGEESKQSNGDKGQGPPDRDYDAIVGDLTNRLKEIEDKIYVMEGEYLKESASIGNIFKGWDMEKQSQRGGQGANAGNYN